MWKTTVTIPGTRTVEINENGFPVETVTASISGIPAIFRDTTRQDEIAASQLGYTVTQNIEMMACNYNGASYLVDDATGDIYDVRRPYHPEKSNHIILTCSRRERGSRP